MSFVMDVARSARVKFLDEHGHEQVDDEDPYLFLRLEAAGSASAPQKRKAADKRLTGGVQSQTNRCSTVGPYTMLRSSSEFLSRCR